VRGFELLQSTHKGEFTLFPTADSSLNFLQPLSIAPAFLSMAELLYHDFCHVGSRQMFLQTACIEDWFVTSLPQSSPSISFEI
jgi:hypothetical protein